MVSELIFSKGDKVGPLVFKAYKELSEFSLLPPSLEALRSHYGVLAQMELLNYVALEYGNDFYDGSPEKSQNFLNDHMKIDTSEKVGIPMELDYESIVDVLNRLNLMFEDDRCYYNSPIQEVW